MLENLKETGKSIGREIGRAWDVASDGWRELFNRSGNALTPFVLARDESSPADSVLAPCLRWSLLAGEVEETKREIVVRIEVPGIDKNDCQIRIEGNRLFVSGKKRFERRRDDSDFHVMERAYGAFQRVIPLPGEVLEDKVKASYQDGVLTIRLSKMTGRSRSIPAS